MQNHEPRKTGTGSPKVIPVFGHVKCILFTETNHGVYRGISVCNLVSVQRVSVSLKLSIQLSCLFFEGSFLKAVCTAHGYISPLQPAQTVQPFVYRTLHGTADINVYSLQPWLF